MCHFVSFLVHRKTGELYFGNLYCHTGIEAGWNLKPDECREAVWTQDSPEYLAIRGDKDNWCKSAILSKFSTRKELLKTIAFGKIDNDKYWYKNGILHREDGPAVEWASGSKFWYKNGKQHREDGPAEEFANGIKRWYKNGKFIKEEN